MHQILYIIFNHQIRNIHLHKVNIFPKITLLFIYLIIPSLFKGWKSKAIVEKEESLPRVGSPTLAHNLQFAIEQSVHPVPTAKKVYANLSHSLHLSTYWDSTASISAVVGSDVSGSTTLYLSLVGLNFL